MNIKRALDQPQKKKIRCRKRTGFMARSWKARHLGEVIVAVLRVHGPLEARDIEPKMARLRTQCHFNSKVIGHVARGTPGVLVERVRPRAIFHLEPGREPQLKAELLDEIMSEAGVSSIPPKGGE